jgi:thiol-disulfide isomerase/thioredoxin
MMQFRHWVPAFGILALATLFLKLPEIPNIFGFFECKTCTSSDPYLPLIAAGYFSLLIAVALLFPDFPLPMIARGGLTWAILLALSLTYILLPDWCLSCLIGHGCHILIWTIWVVTPQATNKPISTFQERFCLMLFVPISVVALFSCLNLTFMAYGYKLQHIVSTPSLQPGDAVPNVITQTLNDDHLFIDSTAAQTTGIVINFISPDCPYCKEQLSVLYAVVAQLESGSCRFINVSPSLSSEMIQQSTAIEWVEDKEGKLRELFKVSGYPTMFVVGTDGKIKLVIPGVPDQLHSYLLTNLSKKR